MRANRTNDQAKAAVPSGPVSLLDQPGVARALLDNVRANVFVADPQLNLVHANEAATEAAHDLKADVYAALRVQLNQNLAALQGPMFRPLEVPAKIGSAALDAHVSRVTGHDGQVVAYVVAWRDVSDQLASVERERHLTERLNETQEVSAAIQAVASATEEMAASSNEIARNASEASQTVAEAVSSVEAANHTMTQLRDASAKINEIVQTITAVAEQTNLLALNATIEAARAGELGKGFAVVAGEVKELSKQTKTATERITEMIDSVQELSRAAAGAIDGISAVIERVNRNQMTIASAVEQQTATTKEISVNLGNAAQRAEQIASFVTTGR